jgi:hypothetical protein
VETKERGELGAGLGALLSGGLAGGLAAYHMPKINPIGPKIFPEWHSLSPFTKRKALGVTAAGIAPLGALAGGALTSDSPIAGGLGGLLGSQTGMTLASLVPYGKIKNPKTRLLAQLLGLGTGYSGGAALGANTFSQMAELGE